MRTCKQCGAEDSPYFEQAPCNCGAPVHDDDPSPLNHRGDCRSLGHSVVLWPIRVAWTDIVHDEAGKEHLLPKYERAGWAFKRDGMKLYRTKMLCRNCIGMERDKLERRKEYEKLCKNVRGEDSKTYSQMLAGQEL